MQICLCNLTPDRDSNKRAREQLRTGRGGTCYLKRNRAVQHLNDQLVDWPTSRLVVGSTLSIICCWLSEKCRKAKQMQTLDGARSTVHMARQRTGTVDMAVDMDVAVAVDMVWWVMKASRLHCVCCMYVRRSRCRSRYRSQRISLLCVRRLFNPPSAGRLQQRQRLPFVQAVVQIQVVCFVQAVSLYRLHSNGFVYILRANVAVFWIMATGTQPQSQPQPQSQSQLQPQLCRFPLAARCPLPAVWPCSSAASFLPFGQATAVESVVFQHGRTTFPYFIQNAAT